MKPIHKDKLKGHYIVYIDKNGKFRTEEVVKIRGRILTVKNCLGRKNRVHLDPDHVKGCIHHKISLRDITS